MPSADHESIERLRKEVERLKSLLELANIRMAHSKEETLTLRRWMARLEKLLQLAGKAGPNHGIAKPLHEGLPVLSRMDLSTAKMVHLHRTRF